MASLSNNQTLYLLYALAYEEPEKKSVTRGKVKSCFPEGERDIAVGNAIGSSIYNILLVLGVTAMVAPAGIAVAQSVQNFDIPVMIAVAVACLPILFTGYRIDRWEGAVFLAYYLAYTGYVILRATEHDLLEPFSRAMLIFVLPITILTLVVVLLRTLFGTRQPPV